MLSNNYMHVNIISVSPPLLFRSRSCHANRSPTYLWHGLNDMGLPMICIDAYHAYGILKLRMNKADKKRCAWHCSDHALRLVQGGKGQKLCQSRNPRFIPD